MKFIKKIIIRWLLDDEEVQECLMKQINPERWWEFKYGNLKNPPPKPNFNLSPPSWSDWRPKY